MYFSLKLIFLSCFFLLTACTASQPKNTENICEIFREKEDWYQHAKNTHEKWGVPIHIQMAIMHQESRFVADAQPPRPYLLGFIPWFRRSSAYGYPQAQDGTWDWYIKDTGVWGADRDNFDHASDFIGWYCTVSHKKLGISKWDTTRQYLAYHEGHGGFKRKSYLKKKWLMNVSKKVNRRADLFGKQLTSCKKELETENSSWFW
jgi:hypothetical protein